MMSLSAAGLPEPTGSNVVPLRRPVAAPERNPHKRSPGITFRKFIAYSTEALELEALDPASGDPLHRRIKSLAEARCNFVGHAHFAEGQLGRELVTLDRRTGDLRPAPANRLSEALAEARARGWIAEGSVPTLVIVPLERAQQGRGARMCPTCRMGRVGG